MDLFLLALFGCVLEVLVTKFGGIMLGTPTITISFLIVILAIIRWNFWGLIIVPFLALATVLGGGWSDIGQYSAFYTLSGDYGNCGLAVFISTMIGLFTIGFDAILFRVKGTKTIIKNPLLLVGIILLNYLVLNLVQFLIFRLITAGTLTHSASIMYVGNTGNEFNLAFYGENGFIRNLLGLAIAVVGILILRSQGVATNVVEKLVDDKKNAELDAKDRHFRIEEAEEEKDMKNEMSESAEEDAKDESEDLSKKQD